MKLFNISAILFLTLLLTSVSYADTFGNGTIKLPTTVSGGTGTVADLQADDDTKYEATDGSTITVGGFGTYGSTVDSVYLFAQYSVEPGYSGTNALQVNGSPTSITPADRDYGRWSYVNLVDFGVTSSAEIASMTVTFTNNDGASADSVYFDCIYVVVNPQTAIPTPPTWVEDFNGTGQADPLVWNYEVGYQRNNEDQYYVAGAANGWQEGGNFVIEGRKEAMGGYNYTSASIVTSNKYYWHYGRAQIRAKIPCLPGMWPAIWGTGEVGQWPHNGEVDIMEFYQNKILANCAVGTTQQWGSKWDSSNRSMTSLTSVDPNWKTQWHIWTMQWDDQNVRLYVDNILMNTIPQTWLKNADGYNTSWGPQYPFISNGMSCWLNLAIGGNAGGDPTATMNSGPQRYFIDYWKVWEGATNNVAPTDIILSSNSVNEGLPAGTVVGDLSAADADPAEVIRYTLVAGTGDTHNSQFTIPEFVSDNTLQGVLKTATVLDYASGATRSIRVRATDIEGASYEKVLTINIIPDADIVVSASTISVPEGGTQVFDVKLRYLPVSNITVNISRSSGDADLSVQSGASLTFTPSNGTTWQQITLVAAEDADITNGSATFLCDDPSSAFNSASLTASELDNDNDQPVVDAGQDQTVYLTGTGGSTPTAGANIFLDAGLDDGANSTWEDSLGLWNLTLSGVVNFISDAGSSLSGITSAYDFPGGLTSGGGGSGTSLQNLAVDTQPITLELWFKPDQSASYPSNGQVLWETGGGTGLGIFYNNGLVEAAHDSNQGQISADVSGLTNEFIQVVVTYDTGSNTDNFNMYINGALAATGSRSDPDMCGSDDSGLGARAGSNTGGAGSGSSNTESFDGLISLFRAYHNRILTEPEVLDNYNSVAGETVDAILDGTVSDPNGEQTTVQWTLVSGPGSVTFADANSVDTTATFLAVGTYILRLTADDGTSVPGYDDVTITVSADPQTGPVVSVSATDASAAEQAADAGTWTISRTGDTVASLAVNFSLGGTAALASDYTVSSSNTITIPAGQSSATVTLNPIDDTTYEGDETATLTISVDAAYTIGTASGTITIADNDPLVLETWIISGQSNAEGYGITESPVANLAPTTTLSSIGRNDLNTAHTDVHFYQGTNDYNSVTNSAGLAMAPKDSWHPMTSYEGLAYDWGSGIGNESGRRFGLELSFGFEMQQQVGAPIALIKYARGSASLAPAATQEGSGLWNDFDPSDGGRANNYDNLISTIQGAVNTLPANTVLNIKGFLWMQGEGDATVDNAPGYETNLAEFIGALRTDVGTIAAASGGKVTTSAGSWNQVDFLVGTIQDYNAYTGTVIAGQNAVAAADSHVFTVNGSTGLSWMTNDDWGLSGLHYDTAGQVLLGERFAGVAINLLTPQIVDVNLPAGISLYGYTGENSIDAMTAFQTLIDNSQLSLVRWVNPSNGNIKELYYTTFPSAGWVNEIGDLTLGSGYVVKTTAICTLSITGNKSTASLSHDLPSGYSIVGFNQETPLDAQAAFQPLIDAGKLDLIRWVNPSNGSIKELYYTTFPSAGWVNEIGDLFEGQGYIIKLNTAHSGFTLP